MILAWEKPEIKGSQIWNSMGGYKFGKRKTSNKTETMNSKIIQKV